MTEETAFSPVAGVPYQLAPCLTVVLAPNPSPMTGLGTNTFLLGKDTLAVIDPGPDNPHHLSALMGAIGDRTVTDIFVTHSHLDHSALARRLSCETGAQIYAFGPSEAGRSKTMQTLAASQKLEGGEGVDYDFQPDHRLLDGCSISGGWGTITAIHTPGHMANHLSFCWNDALFCGDHVMAWSTSLISPPDGDLTAFMQTCEKLLQYEDHVFYPAHGAPIRKPRSRLEWLMAHRKSRESQILDVLETDAMNAEQIAKNVYADLPKGLLRAAQSNVLGHLLDLHQRDIVVTSDRISRGAIFALRAQK